MAWQLESKVYVGDISRDMTEKDLERAFSEFGSIRSVWVATDPSGFAFIQFDGERDAQDAVKTMDGTRLCGEKIRVEMSTGKVRPKPWDRDRGGRRGRVFDSNDKCYSCGGHGHYAYDCRGGGRGRSRSPHRDNDRRDRRSYSRDRRSNSRGGRRSYSRDRVGQRSRSPRDRSDR